MKDHPKEVSSIFQMFHMKIAS